MRPLGIPSIMDKVVQTILKNILEPKCEEIFHSKSYGFRPDKSVQHALLEVQRMTGITWMIEGDIKSNFDNIDHDILVKLIQQHLQPDVTIMNLI